MAFLIFPAEVWEMIIGELNEPIDITNTFIAYPELDVEGALRRKIYLSLFDQVFGCVFPWLTEGEILNCREVCTNWTQTVDNYWANDPNKRAFPHGGQNWIPPAHPSHFHLDEYFPLPKEFSSLEICLDFLEDMEEHPPGRNPFLGREVVISQEGEDSNGIRTYWNEGLLELFSKFGKHVWFLRLCIPNRIDAECPIRLLVKCLPYFSNLKSLEMATCQLSGNKIRRFLRSKGKTLPTFPQLETLGLSNVSLEQSMVNLFVTKYSKQLRRLIIHVKYWKRKYSNLFPDLTELWLCGASGDGEDLTNLLSFIEAPKLHSLEIEFSFSSGPEDSRFYVNSLFPLLARFPQISSAVFTSSSILWLDRGLLSEDNPFSVPSLKHLVIWSDEGHHHEMGHLALGCFPALEYLKVAAKVQVEQLWGILPRLKAVTLKGYYEKQSTYRRYS